MKINGFQKMTMLDFPDKLACTVFTPGCNWRCPFCHNARLVTHIEAADAWEEQEIFSYLQKRQGVLEGVCITGGEPLMQPDLPTFLEKIKALGFLVKVDTNGTFPDRLEHLLASGNVDYVAMDIKNAPEKYVQTVGCPVDMERINQSITLLKEGGVPFEFRTTVVRELHTMEDLLSIGAWIAGSEPYYLQSFTDSGDLIGEGYTSPTPEFLHQAADALRPMLPQIQLRGV